MNGPFSYLKKNPLSGIYYSAWNVTEFEILYPYEESGKEDVKCGVSNHNFQERSAK